MVVAELMQDFIFDPRSLARRASEGRFSGDVMHEPVHEALAEASRASASG
jgi:hypothetical protein